MFYFVLHLSSDVFSHIHIKVCPGYAYKILEQSIGDPGHAAEHERHQLQHYEAEGWTFLNKADGGGLGTIQPVKWTRETVLTEALKYKTKQAWIDGSQMLTCPNAFSASALASSVPQKRERN